MRLYLKICTAIFIVCMVHIFVCGAGLAADEPANYVQAYYFHATFRCKKCTTLEQYSREAIETNFKEQLGNRTLRFNEINFDEPENRHFLQDFNLTYRALVLVRYKDGKQAEFKNLVKVWQLVGNKDAFLEYVKEETEAYLKDL